MAKKFFKQKVHSKKRTITQIIIIIVCVIGIAICFFVAHYFNSKLPEGAVAELRDSVAIEVHGDLPEKTTFFSQLENIDDKDITINYEGVDKDKIGDYPITIKVYKKKYKVTLRIVDTTIPELTVKNIAILEGTKYKARDFVESCTDNSNEDCQITFYDLALDQDGQKIDYANYTALGTYPIQIVASDSSQNQTAPVTVYLTISQDENQKPVENPKPTSCKYGTDDYDASKYIMAAKVSENGCALDLNLYQDENFVKIINNVADNEVKRLKTEFQKLKVKSESITSVNQLEKTILNTTGKGIVGYSLQIQVINSDNEIVEDYFLKLDGSRVFTVNKYNLK